MAIKKDKRNYREHPEENKALIKKSVDELGAGRSILVDNENVIIAGNGVFEQWDDRPIKVVESDGKELIVVKRTDLKGGDEKRKLLAMADNRTSDTSFFDMELLEEDFGKEELEEWGFEIEEESINVEEDNYVISDDIKTDIVLGDLFEIGKHRLLCGDSTDSDQVAKLMDGEKADMLWTDPPYNVDYVGKTKESLKIKNDNIDDFDGFLKDSFLSANENMKNGAVYYIAHPDIFAYEFIGAIRACNWKQARPPVVQWVKNTIVMGRGDYHSKSEPMLYGWKEGAAHFEVLTRDQSNVWEFDKPSRNKDHPTMKPVELIAKAINNHAVKLIMDLFLGSGSTMVASHQLKRKCYGMELDPKYCQVIIDRMLKLDNTLKIKRNGIDETKKWLNNLKENF